MYKQINEKLKKIRFVKLKSKNQRAQSAPNLNLSSTFSYSTNYNQYEEDLSYPGSPPANLIFKNLPTYI